MNYKSIPPFNPMDFTLLCPCHFRTPKVETMSASTTKNHDHLQITGKLAPCGGVVWLDSWILLFLGLEPWPGLCPCVPSQQGYNLEKTDVKVTQNFWLDQD